MNAVIKGTSRSSVGRLLQKTVSLVGQQEEQSKSMCIFSFFIYSLIYRYRYVYIFMCMCIVYGQDADVLVCYFDGDTFECIHAVIDMLQRNYTI